MDQSSQNARPTAAAEEAHRGALRQARPEPENLSPREWLVANEVCSLLDIVAEVNTRIQGSTDTHLSQTTFNVLEVKDGLSGSMHDIRTPDESCSAGAVSTEPAPIGGLTPEAKTL